MKVFYHPKQSIESNNFSPSSGKPRLVVEDWIKHKLPIEVCDFLPFEQEDLYVAHQEEYVDSVLDLKTNNGFGNKSALIAESLLYTNASLYHAAVSALEYKTITCSPTSGFHHAKYKSASGFCTFNGLVIAGRKLLIKGKVKHITIIDLDAHFGDGTEEIIKLLKLPIEQFSFSSSPNRDNGQAFLKELRGFMAELKTDFIIYQAGADPHRNDPLGGFQSTSTMKFRDKIVFESAKLSGIPLVWNLAGGYQDIEILLELHRNTAIEAIEALKK